MRRLLCLLTAIACAPPAPESSTSGDLTGRPRAQSFAAGAILDLHTWTWQAIMDHMGDIQAAGYTAIQISPHTATCGGAYSNGYDPSDFTDFNSRFGSPSDLYWLVQTAHHFGLQIYADLVMNHMCTGATYSYPHFSWNDFHHDGSLSDYSNQWDVENQDLLGLNDLAQESGYVRGQLFNYLVQTNDLGFDGYRLDAAKHVPQWFWSQNITNNTAAWGKYTYGEVYDGSIDYLQGYVNAGMAVTDYALYFAQQSAFRSYGDLSQLDGAGYAAVDGSAALTFVENPDVGPPANRMLAYAFIAAYPGYPLFSSTLLDDPQTRNLVWVHTHLAAGAYRNLFKSHDAIIFERAGNLIAGINQSGAWSSAWVPTSWGAGWRLHDYTGHTGDVWTNGDGWVQVAIPPLSFVMIAP